MAMTAVSNRPTPSSAVRPDQAPPAHSRVPVWILGTGLVLVIVLQRIAVPVGSQSVSITLLIGYGVLGALLAVGALQHDTTRTLLYVVGAGACGFAAWLTTWRGVPMAFMSFLLLLLVYVPWLFRLRASAHPDRAAHDISRLFVSLMTLAGAVSVAQLAAQLAGVWTFEDVVAARVPERWLLGDYNTVIPLQYASPTMKSQAFVFLEPSFLSQFLALGILLALLLRAPLWQPALMGLGMLATFSGTGIVLLGLGLVLLVLRDPRSLRPRLLVGAAVVGAVLLSTPVATPLLDRANERSESTSSWSLRFVLPYAEVSKGLAEAPERYLTGAGPGSAERLLANDKEGQGLAVVYPVAPKLLFEYGVPAGVAFLAFWFVAVLRRGSIPVVPGALVLMLGLLSGSLLQPHTLVAAWLLCLVYGRE